MKKLKSWTNNPFKPGDEIVFHRELMLTAKNQDHAMWSKYLTDGAVYLVRVADPESHWINIKGESLSHIASNFTKLEIPDNEVEVLDE